MTETQQTLTDRIDAALKATEGHTPGPWYGEDQPRTWQLFARRVEPWPDGTPIDLRDDSPEGMELHPLQILKAPKKGTPFAEYWPEPADAALIAAAPDLRALLADALAELRAQAEALAGAKTHLQVMREGHERTVKRALQRGETADSTVAAYYGSVVKTHDNFCAQLDLIAAALGAHQ